MSGRAGRQPAHSKYPPPRSAGPVSAFEYIVSSPALLGMYRNLYSLPKWQVAPLPLSITTKPASAKMGLTVIIKHSGKSYPIEIDASTSVPELRETVYGKTGVAPARQKLLLKVHEHTAF